MNKYEIRRLALIKLIDKLGSQAKLADKLEVNASYISRMLYEEGKPSKKRIGEDMVEKLDSLFKGWLEDGKQELLIQHPSGLKKEEIKILTEFRKIKTDEGVKDIFKYLKMIIDLQTKSTGSSAADKIQKKQTNQKNQ